MRTCNKHTLRLSLRKERDPTCQKNKIKKKRKRSETLASLEASSFSIVTPHRYLVLIVAVVTATHSRRSASVTRVVAQHHSTSPPLTVATTRHRHCLPPHHHSPSPTLTASVTPLASPAFTCSHSLLSCPTPTTCSPSLLQHERPASTGV